MDDLREVIARAIDPYLPEDVSPPFTPSSRIGRAVRQADAALAAIKQAGFVVVPAEPTEEMLEAVESLEPLDSWWPDEPGDKNTPSQIYRAMIEASNAPT